MQKLFFAVSILAAVLFTGMAYGQGDDFPFTPGAPSWNQPSLPVPSPGFDYVPNGMKWGPVQLNNKKYDHIVVRYVLEWWNLGPLLTSIGVTSQANMRWVGPSTAQGQWRGWCLACEWEFDAGDDNVWIWVDFVGTDGFGVHLDIVSITPGSPPPGAPLFSQRTKDNAAIAANVVKNVTGWFTYCGLEMTADGYPGWGAMCGLGATASGVGVGLLNWVNNDPACIMPDYTTTDSFQPSYNDPQALGAPDCSAIDDGTLQWLCYQASETLRQLDATSQGAQVNGDCYNASCNDGNCVSQRKWESLWWLNRHGDYMRDLAYDSWVAAWYCGKYGCDQYWIDQFNNMGNDLDNVGSQEQGMD